MHQGSNPTIHRTNHDQTHSCCPRRPRHHPWPCCRHRDHITQGPCRWGVCQRERWRCRRSHSSCPSLLRTAHHHREAQQRQRHGQGLPGIHLRHDQLRQVELLILAAATNFENYLNPSPVSNGGVFAGKGNPFSGRRCRKPSCRSSAFEEL